MFQPGKAGCAYMVMRGPAGQPRDCHGAPDYAALWVQPHPPHERWRVFLCEEHSRAHEGARLLTENDRTALELRRQRHADAMAGRRWIPPKPFQD